ncbi:MAG: 16S rRNA (cytosine(1402)-N(4))-methyltransferase RsmH [Deltaproteobacteria bacterium]|nr:16S rRNA (cytosine(1402)-N(4))-methyltransferase RsmH [Deltaproteobacteria bacterium]MBW2071623.1 16S rRNA (cytosine(1402)-N(4))-methyltransferase RsmH [Deltaproteobacteria bacterium]
MPLLHHRPVLVEETVELLNCKPGSCVVDCTIGGGGHARAILTKIAPNGLLLGMDWDKDALTRARFTLRDYQNSIILVRENFCRLAQVLAKHGMREVDGILLDLGLSSFHLEQPERGFSFNSPGPLDMRMDTRKTTTAADLVNNLPEKELASLIHRLGEERWSARIARAIVRKREQQPITTTTELSKIIVAAVPRGKKGRWHHPATRTFQALRLAVNEELDNLQDFLAQVLTCLRPAGRLAVISFHSLEDRLVKHTFVNWSRSCRCPKQVVVCRCQGPLVRLITRKPVMPTEEEVAANPRSRSARLRVVEKLEPV